MRIWKFKNIYFKVPEYTVHALPFDGKGEGMWQFDGQIFWIPNKHSEAKDAEG